MAQAQDGSSGSIDGQVKEAEKTVVRTRSSQKNERVQEDDLNSETIDSMKVAELKKKLEDLKLSTEGKKYELQNRLKCFVGSNDDRAEAVEAEEEDDGAQWFETEKY